MRRNKRSGLRIGVDIGGTNTVAALISSTGKIHDREHFPTHTPGGFKEYTRRLAETINRLLCSSDNRIDGIGIGAPAGNSLTGEIISPVHLGWGTVRIIDELMPMLPTGVKVTVTNDANAAALGEKVYGAAREFDNFIELTLGTGVGSGIFVNGRLMTGAQGLAGELGHLRYSSCVGRKCGCGRNGCLDAWCSARGLVATTRELLESEPMSALAELDYNLTAHDVYIAASQGDLLAQRAFEITGTILGNAIADMVTFSDPEAVILFGGLARSGALLLEPTRKAFEENVLYMYKNTEILLSSLPDSDAALLGAAASVTLKL